jgi:hypothetical protein
MENMNCSVDEEQTMEAKGIAIECIGKLGEIWIRKRKTISIVTELSFKR